MSTFAVHFDTDNASFGDCEFDTRYEIANILTEIADAVRNGKPTEGIVRDGNGNKIGEFRLMGKFGLGGDK